MIEIRWHGRGGQGAKTASHLLAEAGLRAGRWVQSYPEYGPERSGAPMRAYNRLDDIPVRRRSPVARPDVSVVLDESLLGEIDVAAGLPADGVLVVNTTDDTDAVRRRAGFDGPVLTVAGNDIAARTGARRANVALLGAVAGVLGEPALADLHAAVRETFAGKLDRPALDAACHAVEEGARAATATGVRIPSNRGGRPLDAGRLLHPHVEDPDLEPFQALRPGAVVVPNARPRRDTGTWREGTRPEIDASRCIHCLLCWVYCPDTAIRVEAGKLTDIDYGLCKGCELCVEVCPVDALAMVPEPRSPSLQLTGGAS